VKIVVCIKQVPDTKGGVKFNPDGTLDRAAMLTIMNPDDKAGLEAALRLKDQYGAEVTVLTMGLPKAEDVLREAILKTANKRNSSEYLNQYEDIYALMSEDSSQEKMWLAYQRSNSFAKEISFQDVIKSILAIGILIKHKLRNSE